MNTIYIYIKKGKTIRNLLCYFFGEIHWKRPVSFFYTSVCRRFCHGEGIDNGAFDNSVSRTPVLSTNTV